MTAFALMGQALAETLQTVHGRLVRNGPLGNPDPVTGVVTPTQTTIYTGTARVKPLKRVTAGSVTAGDARDSQSIFIVSLPIAVTTARAGDIWLTTASTDAALISDVLRVMNVEDSDQITARRLTCELIEART